MAYGSRYVLLMDPDDEDLKDYADQIIKKHQAQLVTVKPACLAALKPDSLLTIIGHGTAKFLAHNFDGAGMLRGAGLAKFLIASCGLKEVGMITLTSCHAGKDPEGLAGTLHKALANFPDGPKVITKVNARTGTVAMQDGMQFVAPTPDETYLYRQKLGTKRVFEWAGDGSQTCELAVEGYTAEGLFRVSNLHDEIEPLPATGVWPPDAASRSPSPVPSAGSRSPSPTPAAAASN